MLSKHVIYFDRRRLIKIKAFNLKIQASWLLCSSCIPSIQARHTPHVVNCIGALLSWRWNHVFHLAQTSCFIWEGTFSAKAFLNRVECGIFVGNLKLVCRYVQPWRLWRKKKTSWWLNATKLRGLVKRIKMALVHHLERGYGVALFGPSPIVGAVHLVRC